MHQPVLLEEVIRLMSITSGGVYIDATVGGAGHAEAILEKAGPTGRLLGLDRDQAAIARVERRLAGNPHVILQQGNFSDMMALAQQHGFENVDGVLFDLGMSSFQVDEPERGFSFMREGPLDMRMDLSQETTAADLVNSLSEEALADLLWNYGEESASRRVARAIVAERPVQSTSHLADIVSRAKGGRHGKTHPATQTFQALRMAVNQEMESIEQGFEAAFKLVRPGGRIGAITFHSIEDRTVKTIFSRHVGRWESLQAGGRKWIGTLPEAKWVNKKPVEASDDEIKRNARARSAKLRVVERLG